MLLCRKTRNTEVCTPSLDENQNTYTVHHNAARHKENKRTHARVKSVYCGGRHTLQCCSLHLDPMQIGEERFQWVKLNSNEKSQK